MGERSRSRTTRRWECLRPRYRARSHGPDYDLDGDLDLYAAMVNEPNRLMRNDGGGVFTLATPPELALTGYFQTAEWCDVDDDGAPDLFVTYCFISPSDKLFLNDGDGTFTDVTAGPMANPGYAYRAAFSDYDNDGRMDLYVTNEPQRNYLYRNLGGGLFADSTDAAEGLQTSSTGVTWGDFNNDGWSDLYPTFRTPA